MYLILSNNKLFKKLNNHNIMTYLIDDAWCIVKEFMLDWRKGWNKKMNLPLQDIKRRLPRILIGERYDMKTKLYYTTFRPSYMKPWIEGEELRVSNKYNPDENFWLHIPGVSL
tara:strand:+ start:477 stop:815 length:339 start_codon:yes stop_codon:yes gene_type:complete